MGGYPGGLANDPVRISYQWCRKLAKERAKNFYYAFLLLDSRQHDAICALYAFMRVCDDLSDEPGMTPAQRREALAHWRRDLDLAMGGLKTMPRHPVWLALYDAVLRYQIPRQYLEEMIDGVESDIEFEQMQTYEDLRRYCYHVASVVGLTIIYIFGFESPEAPALAEKCGLAFQLTNILRDVREDAEAGRVYLPREDLDRFRVSATQFVNGQRDVRFLELMRFEAARARQLYNESRPLVGLVHRKSRPALRALIEIYSRLLDRIVASDFDVLERRIALSSTEKVGILIRERFFRWS